MTSHAKENFLIGLIVFVVILAGLWGTLFVRSFIHTTFEDHEALAGKVVELKSENKKLLAASEVPHLKDELKQAQSDAERWQNAYQRLEGREVVPDRILDSQQIAALHDELQRVASDAKNKDFIKVGIGGSQCQESAHLAWQIHEAFHGAHWDTKWVGVMPKEVKTAYGNGITFGISIWVPSDQASNRGAFLHSVLQRAALESQVNPYSPPPDFKGTLIWVEEKQMFPLDMK